MEYYVPNEAAREGEVFLEFPNSLLGQIARSKHQTVRLDRRETIAARR